MFMGVFRTWIKSLAETSSTLSIVLASATTYLALVAIAALIMQFWDRPIQRFFSSRPAQKTNHESPERGK
jgi:peptidoglycan/LPS O-acetylase OafA/YrhL